MNLYGEDWTSGENWPEIEEDIDWPCPICGGDIGHLPNCPEGICRMKEVEG